MTQTTNNLTLTGTAAIEFAEANGLTLNKYNDPTEDAREGLTVEEARLVAAEDPSLIYIPVRVTGWSKGDGTSTDGYHVADYFASGAYLGADKHGIEPVFERAWENPVRCRLCGESCERADSKRDDAGNILCPACAVPEGIE